MSDGEYDEEWGDSDEGPEPEGDGVEIENNYYEAEGMLKENPSEALERFETVVMLED